MAKQCRRLSMPRPLLPSTRNELGCSTYVHRSAVSWAASLYLFLSLSVLSMSNCVAVVSLCATAFFIPTQVSIRWQANWIADKVYIFKYLFWNFFLLDNFLTTAISFYVPVAASGFLVFRASSRHVLSAAARSNHKCSHTVWPLDRRCFHTAPLFAAMGLG